MCPVPVMFCHGQVGLFLTNYPEECTPLQVFPLVLLAVLSCTWTVYNKIEY